tara:strand:- start:28 stop:195 length:168 start_codon:yes stop_codon:yes gene_type:complete
MTYTYKLAPKDDHAGAVQYIVRKEDNAWIPPDEDNTDYQEYLEWVEAGNTADPAD